MNQVAKVGKALFFYLIFPASDIIPLFGEVAASSQSQNARMPLMMSLGVVCYLSLNEYISIRLPSGSAM
jgi:hypothetical protein